MNASLVDELGLRFGLSFATDRQFYAALIAAPLAWALALASPHPLLPAPAPGVAVVLLAVVWSPLIEEFLFRGVIQGQLGRRGWSHCRLAGISGANAATSILFALAHLIHHPPLWAVAVIAPSLAFGYFRERHHQIYPALILHAAYNACYLAAAAR